ASPLHDDSWTSATVVTSLGAQVAMGAQATIDFDVTTPAEDAETPVMESFVLDDGGKKFGSIDLAVTVVPGMDGPASGDGSEGGATGGCNAGGGGGGLVLVLAALVTGRARRRRAA